MGLAFWASQAIFHKNLLQSLMGEQLVLPAPVWQRLNLAWITFYALMGLLNLYVAYNYTTSTWATFKVFGATGLMLAFIVAQGFYVSQHMEPEAVGETKP
jgi:intracellular septation protein